MFSTINSMNFIRDTVKIEDIDNTISRIDINTNYEFAVNNHLTQHTINDIEEIISIDKKNTV